MDRKRKVYAPFSQTSEAGVTQTPVEGYIDVNQTIYPTVSTGVVNEKGQWAGVKSDDDEFEILGTEVAVGAGASILAPGGNEPFIDMTGFQDLFIAVKPSNGGEYAFEAVMGTDTEPFANLTPVDAAAGLFGSMESRLGDFTFDRLFKDSAQALTADVWNIFIFQERLKSQKNMQFKITNNSGGNSDIQFAYMRLVG
jgi:hypothetical protein